jgi:hypothetical protein
MQMQKIRYVTNSSNSVSIQSTLNALQASHEHDRFTKRIRVVTAEQQTCCGMLPQLRSSAHFENTEGCTRSQQAMDAKGGVAAAVVAAAFSDVLGDVEG